MKTLYHFFTVIIVWVLLFLWVISSTFAYVIERRNSSNPKVITNIFFLITNRARIMEFTLYKKNMSRSINDQYIVQIETNLEDRLIEGMDKGIQGDYEGAIQIFTEILTEFPDSAETYYNRGFTYTKLGNQAEALSDYNQAILLNTNFAEAYFDRARLLNEMGDKVSALRDLLQAAILFKQQNNYHAHQEVLEMIQKLN